MKAFPFVLFAALLFVGPLHAEPEPEPDPLPDALVGWEISSAKVAVEHRMVDGKKVIHSYIATEGVRFTFEEGAGKCEKLEYDRATKSVTFSGKAIVSIGQDILRGGRIVYELPTKKLVSVFGCDSKIPLLKKKRSAGLPMPGSGSPRP